MFRGGRGGRSGNRGSNSSGGSRNTQPKGLFADGIWHCNCTPRLPAEHFKVKKEGKNQGRWFYTCQQGDPKRCGFFLWDDDAKPREEAAVLSGHRAEPVVQEGWNAGRSRGLEEQPNGKGLFQRNQQQQVGGREDESTASPSPPPSYSTHPPNGTKRTAQVAQLDEDDWGFTGLDEADFATAADAAAPQTPHKVQKTGVYASPATTVKRKLPWLEQSATPATSLLNPTEDFFATPSKSSVNPLVSINGPETPASPPTLATAASLSPPSRYKDALYNPADSSSSLTSEVLASLSSVSIPPDIISNMRSILTRHDLKTQGISKGRDISRLAIKAKDAKIAELQARIASLEADREVEREINRMNRRYGRESEQV